MSAVGIFADNVAAIREVSSVASLEETLTGNTTMNVASISLLSNLPEGCVTRTWKNFHILQQAASEVYNTLQENEHAGNQFIAVLSLSKHAIQRLSDEKNVLGGIKFRFAFEGAVGLIKIIPSAGHDRSTDDLTRMMDREFLLRGTFAPMNYSWGSTSRHPATVSSSQKEPDQCLFPIARRPTMTSFNGWPTLVLETGVSESLPRLQADSCWWFKNSGGATRIVLVIAIRNQPQKIIVQKWQLAPAGSPNPLTRAYIEQLRHNNAMAPLYLQPAATQQAFCFQEVGISVTPQGISVAGAPIVLQYQALFDAPNQADIQLDTAFFAMWASSLF